MVYQKGLHIISSIHTEKIDTLLQMEGIQSLVNELIQTYQLVNLGTVYHQFTPGGFTAVICLSESHIAIHTWPEHQLVNYDIYLSNYERQNDQSVYFIDQAFQNYFKGEVVQHTEIYR